MTFTPDETKKLKAMLLYMVTKKHNESAGHCGFQLNELEPILEELSKEGNVQKRTTIHNDQYFLTPK